MLGKTVVVTGGSMGIGLAIAKEAARQGYRVIIASRGLSDLKEAHAQLLTLSTQPHQYRQVDVSDQRQVGEFAAWLATLGTLDGLVNSAGIYGPIGALGDLSMAEFQQAFNINFFGTAFMCQALLPLLGTPGKIINLAGGGAASPFPRYSAYACSKVAIVRLTENLALEYPQHHINCLAPGFVLTRFHQQTLDAGPERSGADFFANTQKQYESGGVSPQSAADLTCFLLSEAAHGISGRFLSAPWDPWQDPTFIERLRQDKNLATLRRIDDKNFQAR